MSFLQVGLVALNTRLLSNGNKQGVFVVSFLISLVWSLNVTKISTSNWKQRIVYAFGAAFGALTAITIF